MSIWADGHKKNIGINQRQEDESRLYHPITDKMEVVVNDTYKDYIYRIVSDGAKVGVFIGHDLHMGGTSGSSVVKLHNRNGKYVTLNRIVSKAHEMYQITYDGESDYTEDNPNGKKYTIKELVADAKAFIDDLIQMDKDVFNCDFTMTDDESPLFR